MYNSPTPKPMNEVASDKHIICPLWMELGYNESQSNMFYQLYDSDSDEPANDNNQKVQSALAHIDTFVADDCPSGGEFKSRWLVVVTWSRVFPKVSGVSSTEVSMV